MTQEFTIEEVQRFALVLDTDVGWDPDDIIAITLVVNYCKRHSFPLAVVTNDETINADRAHFVRSFVRDQTIQVISGAISPSRQNKISESIARINSERRASAASASSIETGIYPSTSLMTYLELYRYDYNIIWLGIGAMTNLAQVLRLSADGVFDGFKPHRIIQMGGRILRQEPAEYNIKLDPAACSFVLQECPGLITFIPLDTTEYCMQWLHADARGTLGEVERLHASDNDSLFFSMIDFFPEGSLQREALIININHPGGYISGINLRHHTQSKKYYRVTKR